MDGLIEGREGWQRRWARRGRDSGGHWDIGGGRGGPERVEAYSV